MGKRRHRSMRRCDRGGASLDAGTTLTEVAVTLGVMSVVMAMVTAGIVQMFRSSTLGEALSVDMTQLQTAFQNLDRAVRYASAISEPNPVVTADGGWYVEWSTVTGGTVLCSQIRLDGRSGRLQRRFQPAHGQVSDWTTVASSLAAGRPFILEPASASGYPHQRLTVSLTVHSASDGSQSGRRSLFTFTALNTSLATTSSGVCAQMGRP